MLTGKKIISAQIEQAKYDSLEEICREEKRSLSNLIQIMVDEFIISKSKAEKKNQEGI